MGQRLPHVLQRAAQVVVRNGMGQSEAPQLFPQAFDLGFDPIQAFHQRLEVKKTALSCSVPSYRSIPAVVSRTLSKVPVPSLRQATLR